MRANSVSTIERRLSAIGWNCAQRGMPLDREDRAIATVLAGIRNRHAAPPRQKEAVLPADLIAMLETLDRGTLRGLRDRAMLLIGFAGGLRRSEITGLDLGRDQTEDGRLDRNPRQGATCDTARQDRLARGGNRPRLRRRNLPVVAVEIWIRLARLAKDPLFRRVTGKDKDVGQTASTTKRSPASSRRRYLPPVFAAISAKASAPKNSQAILCAPGSPLRPRLTNATFRSSSAMPAPR
ncbi:hypothetical protein ILFOPFJJ_05441 [Ensifer psoraleae]|nr:hypothetical protein [Sinorhizobium psoraleae]